MLTVRQVVGYTSTRRLFGSIAQLGEHLPYKQGVTGSSPVVPTKTTLSLESNQGFLFGFNKYLVLLILYNEAQDQGT